jgi:hypothetical protein
MLTNSECVTATLRFAASSGASVPCIDMPVSIKDARRQAIQRSIDREGFELRRHTTAVSDFYDSREVQEIYYPEIVRLVREMTLAELVVVFTHAVRCGEKLKQADTTVQRPFKFVHNDYTATTGPSRAREVLGPRSEMLTARRFCIINLWRPIRGPIQESPLALCDAQSVTPRDFVSIPSQDPSGRTIRIYTLSFSSNHLWSYFPLMQHDEIVLFKTFDSMEDGRARFTFHSAFTDPNTAAEAPPRESIEVRALVVFPTG